MNAPQPDIFGAVPQSDAAVSHDAYGLPPTQNGYAMGRFHCAPGRNASLGKGVYSHSAIAIVLSGAFEYQSASQSGVAVPGSIIVANRSQEFRCNHLTEDGNHRLVIFFNDDLLQSVGAATNENEAPASALMAPSANTTRLLGAFARIAAGQPEGQIEEVISLAETCLATERNCLPGRDASKREMTRVASTVRYINDNFTENCSLERLAETANLSKFRFARIFRAVTGETAAQYVVNRRLAAAAARLAASSAPVSAIAFECGFNDISYFNARFRATFGAPPSKWRGRNERRGGTYRSAVHKPG